MRPQLVRAYRAQAAAQTAVQAASWLPSADHTAVLSLGYRDAAADYLFASTLVDYGLSFEGKQRFEAAYRRLDVITRLSPQFAQPYLYADALLTLQSQPARPEDYRRTLALHQRGARALPLHTELHSVAGQFAAYLAPRFLPEAERQAAREAGARLMARACELASDNQNIPYHCITAARLLERAGEREAMVRMLRRTLAVNDDPEIRERALAFLQAAAGERARERQLERLEALDAVWKARFPHIGRNLLSLVGPGPEPDDCAGPDQLKRFQCATTWGSWQSARERSH